MKIRTAKTPTVREFSTLDSGDVFAEEDGDISIKNDEANAIRVDTGYMWDPEDDLKVTFYPNATLDLGEPE